MKTFLTGLAAGIGLAGGYAATRSSKQLETTVAMVVNTPVAAAFHYIVPIKLMHIFRGTAFIPAIVDTSIKEGWNTAGLTRTIYFKDGSTSQEQLRTIDPPTSFSYTNDHFTSPMLKALLVRIEGEWHFTALKNNQTHIAWTYRAIPTNGAARLVVAAVLMRAVRMMMKRALTIAVQDLESGQLSGGQFVPDPHP